MITDVITSILRLLERVARRPRDTDDDIIAAIEEQVACLEVDDLPALDSRARSSSWAYYTHGDWERLDPHDVLEWSRRSRCMLRLASMGSSGFVRERAVDLLAESMEGDDLPYLLLRTADWVGPVQRKAVSAVQRALASGDPMAWMTALPVLNRVRRSDRATFVRELPVEALLLRSEHTDMLVRGLRSVCRSVVRACAEVVMAVATPDARLLAEMRTLAQGCDAVLATRAATWLIATASTADRHAIVGALFEAPVSSVRFLGLEAAAADPGFPNIDRWLRRAEIDRVTALRELGRFLLGKRGVEQGAPTYRAILGSSDAAAFHAVALRGLAEVGDASDVQLVRPFLCSPQPQLRREALGVLAKRGGADADRALQDALGDPNRRVALAAAAALIERDVVLPEEWLRTRLGPSGGALEAKLAADGMYALPYWSAVIALAEATSRAGERQRPLILRWLLKRLEGHRGGLSPTQDEQSKLERLSGHPALAELRERLVSELEAWKPRAR